MLWLNTILVLERFLSTEGSFFPLPAAQTSFCDTRNLVWHMDLFILNRGALFRGLSVFQKFHQGFTGAFLPSVSPLTCLWELSMHIPKQWCIVWNPPKAHWQLPNPRPHAVLLGQLGFFWPVSLRQECEKCHASLWRRRCMLIEVNNTRTLELDKKILHFVFYF